MQAKMHPINCVYTIHVNTHTHTRLGPHIVENEHVAVPSGSTHPRSLPGKISTRPPSSALLPTFWQEGSPTKIDYRRKLVPLFYPLYWRTWSMWRVGLISGRAFSYVAPATLDEPGTHWSLQVVLFYYSRENSGSIG